MRNTQQRGTDSPFAEVRAKRLQYPRECISHSPSDTGQQEGNRQFEFLWLLGHHHGHQEVEGLQGYRYLKTQLYFISITIEKSGTYHPVELGLALS